MALANTSSWPWSVAPAHLVTPDTRARTVPRATTEIPADLMVVTAFPASAMDIRRPVIALPESVQSASMEQRVITVSAVCPVTMETPRMEHPEIV